MVKFGLKKLLVSAFFAHGYTNKVVAMLAANAVGLTTFAGRGRRFERQAFDVGLFFAVRELGCNGLFSGGDAGRNDRFGFGVHSGKIEVDEKIRLGK